MANKTTIKLATWNVQRMGNKTVEIIKELSQQRIDVAVLSETKKKWKWKEGLTYYLLIWSGVNQSERAASGVTILIQKKHKDYIKKFECESNRIITLTIYVYGCEIIISGV